MRYYVRAYPMHESEVAAIGAETAAGGIAAEIHDGLIEGVAEEEAIARLAAQGIVVRAIAQVPDAAAPVRTRRGSQSAPSAASPHPTAGFQPAAGKGGEYWLATLLTGLSEKAIGDLTAAGAQIVERDPSGAIVLRVTTDPAAVSDLPFVAELRPYGIEETLEGAVSALPDAETARPRSRRGAATAPARRTTREALVAPDPAKPATARFEALCHRSEDRARVAQAIEALGGTTVGGSGRAVRFVLNRVDLPAVSALPGVASVSGAVAARLLVDHARPMIGLERGGPPPVALPFDGSGEVVGVADTGLDSLHRDFAPPKRVVAVALGRPGDTSDPSGHGTHVAGTIVGSGRASLPPGAAAAARGPLRGVAPAANLFFQSVLDVNGGLGGLPESLGDLFQPAYDAGVRVHNNSWGAYIQARYDGMALDVDAFVADHPDFLPVIAAGNEGSCRNALQAARGFVDYSSLGAPATAKNGLTVGASRSDRTSGGLSQLRWNQAWPDDFFDDPIGSATVSGDGQGLAAFSSRGPCDDKRIKPDVVAPGTDIAATRSRDAPLANFWGAYPGNRQYAFMGGTSMACPIVAGCAVLTRQYFRTSGKHDRPSAALLKAALINGATPLNGSDAIAAPAGAPNYHQGFGRIDLARTLPDPAAPRFALFFVDTWNRNASRRIVNRRARLRWTIDIAAAGELRIALVWTDPPARGLQNQLRIILDTIRDGAPRNWVGNDRAAAPLKFAAHDPRALLPGQTNVITRDPQNNVQVIRAEVVPGRHTLALFADSLIQLPQDFALVATCPVGSSMRED